MSVLYITQNGVTDHIGRSQVAPYIVGLARMGFKIHVLSAEKVGQEPLINSYNTLFESEGVHWTHVRYRNKPKLIGQGFTHWLMLLKAREIIRNEGIRLVHCRSFPPAIIGYQLQQDFGISFVFDFRDFYADGGLRKFKGLKRLAYQRMKQLEGPMVRAADKIICLTENAREVLTKWYLSDNLDAARQFQVIPCCADFEHFNQRRVSSLALSAIRSKLDLNGNNFVLLYLGSLGPDYLLPQMLLLFKQVLNLFAQARFLFVSNNGHDLVVEECNRQGIDLAQILFISADRNDVPTYIELADLSVIFIHAGISKAGCSPTKLAELLAMNVPVIVNSGVGDLDAIVSLERNGSVVVHDFLDSTLREAVLKVVGKKASGLSIRENSWEFDVSTGVARYADVYNKLLE